MSELDDFRRWCAQFSDFPYNEVVGWIEAYRRGDGTDYGGRPLRLASGRTLQKRK